MHPNLRPYFYILICFIIGVLTACGGSNSPTPIPTPPPAPPPPPPPPPTGEIALDINGIERWLTLIRPDNTPNEPTLVILLHGGTGSMRSVLNAAGSGVWNDIAQEEGFILIAPNGTDPETGDTFGSGQHWNDAKAPFQTADSDADDVSFILAILDWAVATHGVNPDRIFITGISNGGMMTFRMLNEAPERFAAGATFIANLPAPNPLVFDHPQPVPIFMAMGTEDPIMLYAGGNIANSTRLGVIRSAVDTRDWWIDQNTANPIATRTHYPDNDPDDGCTIFHDDFPALQASPQNGANVRYVTLQGGGHSMPSTNPNATSRNGNLCKDMDGGRLAWTFFTQQ